MKNKGFAAPLIIIILAVVTSTAGIGSYIYNKNVTKAKKVENTTSKVQDETKEKVSLPTTTETPKPITSLSPTSSLTANNEIKANSKNENTEKPNENDNKTDSKKSNETSTYPTKVQEKKQINYTDQPHPGGFTFIENELNLTAASTSQGVILNWTRCNSNQFVAYKVARSETAPDVYFPRDGAILSISNQDQLSIIDQSVEKGKTYYYRICSYESNGESWCGNVSAVNH